MTILGTIQAAAKDCPLAPALLWPGGAMAYAELMDRVDGLASDLRSLNVGPDARVAICLERSPEMVIAILATLAAGAAYVPLEANNPDERLRDILADAQPALVLAEERRGDAFGDLPVHLARTWSRSAARRDAKAQAPAYLIYTSGSTGRPKGVVIGHRALENYLDWACRNLPRGEVPLLSSMAFDLAVTAFYPPLMRGDPLYLLPPLRGGRDLAAGLLDGRTYGYVKITPSHCRLLTRDQRALLGRVAGLVMFGGEHLAGDLVEHVRRDRPDLPVMNHYGPTEATVGCCVHQVPTGFGSERLVPIGKPLPGLRADLRAEGQWAEEEGAVGELWIGGEGLAEGYWNDPVLTKAAFVHAEDSEELWYRTGDLASRDESGAYLYWGRVDHQVKILGHRLEPREVEVALAGHPAVADCAVLAEEAADKVRIVAAVASSTPGLQEAELVEHLRAKLPGPMIPSHILVFERLPVLETGKLDRDGILRGVRDSPPQEKGAVSALSVARQFRHALGIEAIDEDADFFDLGGDSLAALEITTWANQTFGIDLDLSVMFECATVRSLTERIVEASRPIASARMTRDGGAGVESS